MTDTENAFTLLAAANPVPELPAAEPPERLRRLIEAEDQAVSGAHRHTPAGKLVRPTAAALVAILAATVSLLLSNGASSPSLNIAAAAYAATSSGSGVLEARFVDRMFLPHRRVVTSLRREWIDPSTGMRRERRTLSALVGRHPRVVYELASAPGWIETWSSAAGERNTVQRVRYPQAPPGGHAVPAPAGIATYRQLYRERSIRLTGRERRGGRRLWKLEGDVAFAFHSLHAKPVPIVAIVVLVDPHTYLPVVQRTVSLLPRNRRQVQMESQLLDYRRLPGGTVNEALLKLSAQHPRTRVVTNPTTTSHYVRQRVP
jgi:hypothetical protein